MDIPQKEYYFNLQNKENNIKNQNNNSKGKAKPTT
jgi:hypothetical protein